MAGCASMGSVKTERDEFTGRESTDVTYNPLAGSSLFDDAQVRFLPGYSPSDGYYINIVVHGNSGGWVFIEEGETLRFIVDGERLSLAGAGSVGNREVLSSYATTWEAATYPTSREFLQGLATAKEVKVRLDGSRRQVERHFSDANFKNLIDFLEAIQ